MPPLSLNQRLKAIETSVKAHLEEAPMVRTSLIKLETDISWIKKGVVICVSASVSLFVAVLGAVVKFSLSH